VRTSRLVESAGAAFAYFYHRDKMNAVAHYSDPKFSPITFALARDLTASGVETPELADVVSHAGHYPLDHGR
jgi:hypothetical protein